MAYYLYFLKYKVDYRYNGERLDIGSSYHINKIVNRITMT